MPPLSVGRNSTKQLNVLGTVSAQSLLYLSCDQGTFSFAGDGDPLTIAPKGATASYFCEFQADRANGTTVSGSFRVDPV